MNRLFDIAPLLAGLREAASRRDRALRTRDEKTARRAFNDGTRLLAQALRGDASSQHPFGLTRLLGSTGEAPEHLGAWGQSLVGNASQARYIRAGTSALAIVAHPRRVARDFRSRLSCGLEARALPVPSWWSRAATPLVVADQAEARVWSVVDALYQLVRAEGPA
jgi:hypothetical protein